jgi:GNAT superfamily N-acetyltransferase
MRTSRDLCLIPMRHYSAIMHPIVDGYLDHPSVRTFVDVGDTGMLRGFIAADPSSYLARVRGDHRELAGYIYFTYVAAPFRGWGIARTLLQHAGIDPGSPFGYAVRTRSSFEARSKIPLAEYDPHRARFLTMEVA